MGAGIAQVFAQAGYHVTMYDIKNEALDKGYAFIDKMLSRNVSKGRIKEDEKDSILKNLNIITNLHDHKQSELVIETVVEQIEVKTKLFQQLESIVPAETILATNTSSLTIIKIDTVKYSNEANGKSDRDAFYESSACDETSRNYPRYSNKR